MRRDLLLLSWAELTTDERWALGGFLVRRAIAAVAMCAALLLREPALAIVGAALYLDARLKLR